MRIFRRPDIWGMLLIPFISSGALAQQWPGSAADKRYIVPPSQFKSVPLTTRTLLDQGWLPPTLLPRQPNFGNLKRLRQACDGGSKLACQQMQRFVEQNKDSVAGWKQEHPGIFD